MNITDFSATDLVSITQGLNDIKAGRTVELEDYLKYMKIPE
jgi:hypothetical protein